MLTYLINNLIISLLITVTKKTHLFIWILVSVSVMLYLLPSTGQDYYFYKLDYDSSYFDGVFPYFHSASRLDSEPFYKFYTSLIRVTTSLPFNGFLVLNWVLCSLLLFKSLRKVFTTNSVVLFFSFSLLSIVPTIYYFSPRSSISFVFAVFAFIYYVKNDFFKGLLFSFLSIGCHSQFIPILFTLSITSVFNKLVLRNKREKTFYIVLFTLSMTVILVLLLKFPQLIHDASASVMNYLPSEAMIEGKLQYFESARSGVRITALLSIFVFPFLYMMAVKNDYFHRMYNSGLNPEFRQNFILFLGLSTWFSIIVNVLFIDAAHIAGRLSRFSDFISLMVIVPTLLSNVKHKAIILPMVLVFLAIVVAFVYPTLYNFEFSIF